MQKIINNFGFVVAQVIGIKYYLLYLFFSLVSFFKIAKTKNLNHVDFLIGKTDIKKFKVNQKKIVFDCRYTDKNIVEDSFAFGLIREIYIRNCYLKFIPLDKLLYIENTIDLGSNRGVFSCLSTTFSKKIVGVEIELKYQEVFKKNLELNLFSDYFLETKKIVQDDEVNPNNSNNFLGIENLFKKHEIKNNCFIKIDIEGGETSLFRKTDWLNFVDILAMEVHPLFGVPTSEILEKLKKKNFNLITANDALVETSIVEKICFVYAWKN